MGTKKTALALPLVMGLLFSAVTGAQFVNLGAAETNLFGLSISASIPEGSAYTVTNYETYITNQVTLLFLVDRDDNYHGNQVFTSLYTYSLDGQGNVTFSPSSKNIEVHDYSNGGKSVTEINSIILPNLSDGNHSIIVYAKMGPVYWRQVPLFGIASVDVGSITATSNTKLFTIDTEAPRILISSPENKTYYPPDIPLNFTINEPVTQISYRLDESEYVLNATTGNATLTGLSVGTHELTIYATDTVGHPGVSETITFSIAKEPFPATFVILVVVLFAVICIGLLVDFNKRKR